MVSIEEYLERKEGDFRRVGNDEIVLQGGIRRELEGIQYQWVNYQGLKEKGIDPQSGFAFSGPPGTGKTLTACYLLTQLEEKGVNCYNLTEDPLKLPEAAKYLTEKFWKNGDFSVIFIDDITVGDKRREEKKLKDALKEILDGSKDYDVGILVTTNDEPNEDAVWRAGRLHPLYFGKPGPDEREEIIRLYLEKYGQGTEYKVDVELLRDLTDGNTPAEIETWIKRGVLEARRVGKTEISTKDIGKQILHKEIIDYQRNRRLGSQDKERILIHELGHVLVALCEESRIGPLYITCIPTLRYDGAEVNALPPTLTTRELEALIKICLGGYVMEKLYSGTTSLGCEGDLHKAEKMAGYLFNILSRDPQKKEEIKKEIKEKTKREEEKTWNPVQWIGKNLIKGVGDCIFGDITNLKDEWIQLTLENYYEQVKDVLSTLDKQKIMKLVREWGDEEIIFADEVKRKFLS